MRALWAGNNLASRFGDLPFATACAAFYILQPGLAKVLQQLTGRAVSARDMAAGDHRVLGPDLPGAATGLLGGVSVGGAVLAPPS